jgi:protein-tyrosine phosphatase
MNPYQGNTLKALFVCSGGILRSPTAAHFAHKKLGWNTRSAGILVDAVPQVTGTLLRWADHIFCLERKHESWIVEHGGDQYLNKITVLDIPDNFRYGDEELLRLLDTHSELK